MKARDTEVFEVDINKIDVGENFRGKVGSVATLMSSIEENGLLQPVGVQKQGSRYLLAFGRRRLTACKKLGHKQIMVRLLSDDLNRDTINLIENMQRQDVSLYEVGRGIHHLITKDNMSHDEIAVKLSVNKSFIRKALDHFNYTPPAFRDNVKSLEPHEKKVNVVSSSVSSLINNTAQRFKLTKAQVNSFYNYALKNNLTSSETRVICALIASGKSFTQATKQSKRLKVYRPEIVISTKAEEQLIQKFGKDWINVILKGQRMHKIEGIVELNKK